MTARDRDARAGGTVLRSLFALPPSPAPRRWIATRAALSIGVPFGVLTLLGHEKIGLQAAAGAFVALFFAGAGAAERAKALPVVGAALLACAALGAAFSPWPWLLAAGLVAVTVCASALAFAFRVGPPGPVFFVLSYGLSANITAVVDGERITAPWTFLAAMACGSLFSYLVALAPLLRRLERDRPVRPLRELLPGPWLGAGERELVLRIAVVAVLGTLATTLLLDPHRAYWTVSAGVAVIGLTPSRGFAVGRGLHRTVGTLLGAALAVGRAGTAQRDPAAARGPSHAAAVRDRARRRAQLRARAGLHHAARAAPHGGGDRHRGRVGRRLGTGDRHGGRIGARGRHRSLPPARRLTGGGAFRVRAPTRLRAPGVPPTLLSRYHYFDKRNVVRRAKIGASG